MSLVSNRLFLIVLIMAVNSVNAFSPSGEHVSPFNEHTGNNLFTGSATYAFPLLTVTSKGGASIPIGLGYSSNVNINARSRNDVAPTSWVGLGWSLGFGKIIADHKETMTNADDRYVYITPEGVPLHITPTSLARQSLSPGTGHCLPT